MKKEMNVMPDFKSKSIAKLSKTNPILATIFQNITKRFKVFFCIFSLSILSQIWIKFSK